MGGAGLRWKEAVVGRGRRSEGGPAPDRRTGHAPAAGRQAVPRRPAEPEVDGLGAGAQAERSVREAELIRITAVVCTQQYRPGPARAPYSDALVFTTPPRDLVKCSVID